MQVTMKAINKIADNYKCKDNELVLTFENNLLFCSFLLLAILK